MNLNAVPVVPGSDQSPGQAEMVSNPQTQNQTPDVSFAQTGSFSDTQNVTSPNTLTTEQSTPVMQSQPVVMQTIPQPFAPASVTVQPQISVQQDGVATQGAMDIPISSSQMPASPQYVSNSAISSVQVQATPVVQTQQAMQTQQAPQVVFAPTASQIQPSSPPVVINTAWGNLGQQAQVQPPESANIQLGPISGSSDSATRLREAKQSNEKVQGIIVGNNVSVAEDMSKSQSEASEEEPVHKVHPLADLYSNLEKMAANTQLLIEQEAEADRNNKNLEELKDEATGWQITGKITHILMVFSWIMAALSICFPAIFNLPKSEGISFDFILFVVTIMLLLTCTVLSFWIRANPVIKLITWSVFVFFIVVFIIISLKSGGVISGDIPVLNTFVDRFSF